MSRLPRRDSAEWAYPPNWDPELDLTGPMLAVLEGSDCTLVQGAVQLSFVLAAVLLSIGDVDERVRLTEVLAAKLLEAARSGRIPGEEVMQ